MTKFLSIYNKLEDVYLLPNTNVVILSASLSQTPNHVIAINNTVTGAVAAQVDTIGVWSSSSIAGINAMSPKNLCFIRDAVTKRPMSGSGVSAKHIFGLLQYSGNLTDSFANDTTFRAQISFVTFNSGTDTWVSASASNIGNRVLEYAYQYRQESTGSVFEEDMVNNMFSFFHIGKVG